MLLAVRVVSWSVVGAWAARLVWSPFCRGGRRRRKGEVERLFFKEDYRGGLMAVQTMIPWEMRVAGEWWVVPCEEGLGRLGLNEVNVA